VLVDEVEGPWTFSVWVDPDIGTGTFWVQTAGLDGQAAPDDTLVDVHITPADRSAEETDYPGRAEDWRDGRQFVAKVGFDRRAFYVARIVLRSASTDRTVERILRVEATPPGYGPIDLLIYSWPFVFIALIWVKVMAKKRAIMRELAVEPNRGLASEEAAGPKN
jgi:hypothetical protein